VSEVQQFPTDIVKRETKAPAKFTLSPGLHNVRYSIASIRVSCFLRESLFLYRFILCHFSRVSVVSRVRKSQRRITSASHVTRARANTIQNMESRINQFPQDKKLVIFVLNPLNNPNKLVLIFSVLYEVFVSVFDLEQWKRASYLPVFVLRSANRMSVIK
jgi:hypothetical protein